MIERRKSPRFGTTLPAEITIDEGGIPFRATVVDVSGGGLGLRRGPDWPAGAGSDGSPIRIAVDTGTSRIVLQGRLRLHAQIGEDLPGRTDGVELTHLVAGYDDLLSAARSAEGVSSGKRRSQVSDALAGIAGEKSRAKAAAAFEDLKRSGSNSERIARNLCRDRNVPGVALRNFLSCMAAAFVGSGSPEDPPRWFVIATRMYRAKHLHADMKEWDRPVPREVMGDRLGRILPRGLVESWLKGGNVSPGDIIEACFTQEPGSQELLLDAILAYEARVGKSVWLTREADDPAWVFSARELEERSGSGLSDRDLIEALEIKWSGDGIAFLYPTESVESVRKPTAVHASDSPAFIPTPCDAPCGRTSGTPACRGLSEAVHPSKAISDVLTADGRIKAMRGS